MRLITERELIRTVAAKWAKQYRPGSWSYNNEKAEITRRLFALNPEMASREDVDKIIGNNSWTTIRCNECNAYVSLGIQVGEEPDIESQTVILCSACVLTVYTLLQERPACTYT